MKRTVEADRKTGGFKADICTALKPPVFCKSGVVAKWKGKSLQNFYMLVRVQRAPLRFIKKKVTLRGD